MENIKSNRQSEPSHKEDRKPLSQSQDFGPPTTTRTSSIANQVTQLPFPDNEFTTPASYLQNSFYQTQPASTETDPSPLVPSNMQLLTPSISPPPPPPLTTSASPRFNYHASENPYDDSPYAPPIVYPLSLEEAIQQLPAQYLRALIRPSVVMFRYEIGKATWNIVWFQVIVYTLLSSLFALIPQPNLPTSSSMSFIASWGFIFVPLLSFVVYGFYYVVAKLFKGRGTFVQHCYATLLYSVPLSLIANAVRLLPTTGIFLALALEIYGLFITVRVFQAVHSISMRKAIFAVLIGPTVLIVLFGCLVAGTIGVIVGMTTK